MCIRISQFRGSESQVQKNQRKANRLQEELELIKVCLCMHDEIVFECMCVFVK